MQKHQEIEEYAELRSIAGENMKMHPIQFVSIVKAIETRLIRESPGMQSNTNPELQHIQGSQYVMNPKN
jgi:hypothetical protein